jgi:hypothetical protein
MPHYRFIIEGSGFQMPSFSGDPEEFVTGFFTTRKANGIDEDAAKATVLETLESEWSEYAPSLSVLDGWKINLIEFPRVPNAGHVFFSDSFSRYAAASIEAQASRAPKRATIMQLARLHIDDDDD